MPNVYKLNTVSLFNDLKGTNIKTEDFKQILSSYQKLESTYAKNKDVDLLKDLYKQRDTVLSYLPSCRQESTKRIAHLLDSLNKEVGNVDEIDTFETPEKNVEFIKVAYNKGKWTIEAHNLDEIQFSDKETPEAIECLVNLTPRLDEQEAAYALCHAKKAGLFTMATLPYVRTEEFTNTALEPRYVKDPGTVLGPIEHSWESSVDNTNMPVSRQIASEEFPQSFDELQEASQLEDSDGSMIFVSAKDSDSLVANNEVYMRDEVDEKLQSGEWKLIAAAKEDVKVQRLIKEAESLIKAFEPKLIADEAAQRVAAEINAKIEEAQKAKKERNDEIEASVAPRLRKIAAKIDSITLKDKKGVQKLQKLRKVIGNLELQYSREVPEYQKRTVSVEQAEEVLAKMRDYVSPRNLKAFDELSEQLFKFNSRAESFSVTLTGKDPRNEELIQEEMKKLHKQIKMSQNEAFDKDAAYEALDKMLVAGQIDFAQYNTLSDYAEMDSKMVLASLNTINSKYNKEITAGILTDALAGLKDLFLSAKEWIMEKLSFLTLQDKEITDINEELDTIVEG